MREILFKGKRIDNGEWVYGCLVYDSDGGMAYIVEKVYWNVEDCVDETAYKEVLHHTIGKYTGLLDDTGRKIFEGDILKLQCGDDEWIATVEFGNPNCEYTWGWQLVGDTGFNKDILLWVETEMDSNYCEVIGNIHDKEGK